MVIGERTPGDGKIERARNAMEREGKQATLRACLGPAEQSECVPLQLDRGGCAGHLLSHYALPYFLFPPTEGMLKPLRPVRREAESRR